MNDSEGSANTLWLGTGGNRDSPLFKDPEQLRRKFRAWMWPHDFEVKYIEFYPDFTWGTIGMESSAACTVLLEHAKNHPFKPEGGKVWEVKKYKEGESPKDPVLQSLLATNDKLRHLEAKAAAAAAAKLEQPKKPKVVDNIIKSSTVTPAPSEAGSSVKPTTCDSGTSPTPPPEMVSPPPPPIAESPRLSKSKKTKRKSRHKSGEHVSRSSRPSSRQVEELLLREAGSGSSSAAPNSPETKTKNPKKKKHRDRSRDRPSSKSSVVSAATVPPPMAAPAAVTTAPKLKLMKRAQTIQVESAGVMDLEEAPDMPKRELISMKTTAVALSGFLPPKIEQQMALDRAKRELKEQLEKDLQQLVVDDAKTGPLTIDDIREPEDLNREKFVMAVANLQRFYEWDNKDDPEEAERLYQQLLQELDSSPLDKRRNILYRSLDDASNAMADKKETTEKAEEVRRSGNIYISYLNDPTVPASKPDFVDECSALDPALSELTPLTSISEVNGTTGVLELGEVATAPAPLAKQAIEPATAPREDFGNCDSPADPMEEPVSVITEEVPTVLYGGYATVDQIESMMKEENSAAASTNLEMDDDLATETGTVIGAGDKPEKLESMVVMYTEDLGKISKAFQAPKSLDRWYALECWLKIHYFDRHKELASLYARWMICVLAAAGQTPVGLEADLEVHMVHGLDKFCAEMADVLEKYLKQTDDALGILQNEVVSISTIIHACLCYLLAKHFPAFSVPRPLNRVLQSIPYCSSRTCSLYQTRGVVVKFFNPHLGLIQSPRGCVFFGPANVMVGNEGDPETENVSPDLEKRLPRGSFVLFDASCYIDQYQGKKLLYTVASRVANQNVKLESEHKEAFYSLPLINNGGEAYFHSLRRQCCKEVFEDPEKFRPLLDVITTAPAPKATTSKALKALASRHPEINESTTAASIYSKELNKLCENLENNDILDFAVSGDSSSTFDSLVGFFKTQLTSGEPSPAVAVSAATAKGDQVTARERERMYLANHYAAVWIRMGYDQEQLEEDFHTLYALGSWGTVLFNWENLFTRYHLPYCVDVTKLLSMTCQFIAKTEVGSRGVQAKYKIDNPEVLLAVVEKRAEHERHYMVIKSLSKTKQGRFAKEVGLLKELFQQRNGLTTAEQIFIKNATAMQEKSREVHDHVKIKAPNGPTSEEDVEEEILSFETDKDGNLSLEKVSVFIKGVLALKYKMPDNVWRIVSMEYDVLQKPQDGWGHRIYIPITSSLSRSNTPCPSDNVAVTVNNVGGGGGGGLRVHYLDAKNSVYPTTPLGSTPRPPSSAHSQQPPLSPPATADQHDQPSYYSSYLNSCKSDSRSDSRNESYRATVAESSSRADEARSYSRNAYDYKKDLYETDLEPSCKEDLRTLRCDSSGTAKDSNKRYDYRKDLYEADCLDSSNKEAKEKLDGLGSGRYDYLDRLETSRVTGDVSSRLELDPTSAMARSSYITGSSVFERKSDLVENRYSSGGTVADRLETSRRLRVTTPSPPPSSTSAINSAQRSSATANRHLY